jgi:hypothetical protein
VLSGALRVGFLVWFGRMVDFRGLAAVARDALQGPPVACPDLPRPDRVQVAPFGDSLSSCSSGGSIPLRRDRAWQGQSGGVHLPGVSTRRALDPSPRAELGGEGRMSYPQTCRATMDTRAARHRVVFLHRRSTSIPSQAENATFLERQLRPGVPTLSVLEPSMRFVRERPASMSTDSVAPILFLAPPSPRGPVSPQSGRMRGMGGGAQREEVAEWGQG